MQDTMEKMIIRGGEIYSAPSIEVISVLAEQGFAGSVNGEGGVHDLNMASEDPYATNNDSY